MEVEILEDGNDNTQFEEIQQQPQSLQQEQSPPPQHPQPALPLTQQEPPQEQEQQQQQQQEQEQEQAQAQEESQEQLQVKEQEQTEQEQAEHPVEKERDCLDLAQEEEHQQQKQPEQQQDTKEVLLSDYMAPPESTGPMLRHHSSQLIEVVITDPTGVPASIPIASATANGSSSACGRVSPHPLGSIRMSSPTRGSTPLALRPILYSSTIRNPDGTPHAHHCQPVDMPAPWPGSSTQSQANGATQYSDSAVPPTTVSLYSGSRSSGGGATTGDGAAQSGSGDGGAVAAGASAAFDGGADAETAMTDWRTSPQSTGAAGAAAAPSQQVVLPQAQQSPAIPVAASASPPVTETAAQPEQIEIAAETVETAAPAANATAAAASPTSAGAGQAPQDFGQNLEELLEALPPGPIHVTVAVRVGAGGRRPRGGGLRLSEEDTRSGYMRGHACGVFDVTRYLAGRDCIHNGSRWMSRSNFEKVGGSKMAKWYRSIRVMPELEPLGEWLERHNLPVTKGPARRSRKRPAAESGDEQQAQGLEAEAATGSPPATASPGRQHGTTPLPVDTAAAVSAASVPTANVAPPATAVQAAAVPSSATNPAAAAGAAGAAVGYAGVQAQQHPYAPVPVPSVAPVTQIAPLAHATSIKSPPTAVVAATAMASSAAAAAAASLGPHGAQTSGPIAAAAAAGLMPNPEPATGRQWEALVERMLQMPRPPHSIDRKFLKVLLNTLPQVQDSRAGGASATAVTVKSDPEYDIYDDYDEYPAYSHARNHGSARSGARAGVGAGTPGGCDDRAASVTAVATAAVAAEMAARYNRTGDASVGGHADVPKLRWRSQQYGDIDRHQPPSELMGQQLTAAAAVAMPQTLHLDQPAAPELLRELLANAAAASAAGGGARSGTGGRATSGLRSEQQQLQQQQEQQQLMLLRRFMAHQQQFARADEYYYENDAELDGDESIAGMDLGRARIAEPQTQIRRAPSGTVLTHGPKMRRLESTDIGSIGQDSPQANFAAPSRQNSGASRAAATAAAVASGNVLQRQERRQPPPSSPPPASDSAVAALARGLAALQDMDVAAAAVTAAVASAAAGFGHPPRIPQSHSYPPRPYPGASRSFRSQVPELEPGSIRSYRFPVDQQFVARPDSGHNYGAVQRDGYRTVDRRPRGLFVMPGESSGRGAGSASSAAAAAVAMGALPLYGRQKRRRRRQQSRWQDEEQDDEDEEAEEGEEDDEALQELIWRKGEARQSGTPLPPQQVQHQQQAPQPVLARYLARLQPEQHLHSVVLQQQQQRQQQQRQASPVHQLLQQQAAHDAMEIDQYAVGHGSAMVNDSQPQHRHRRQRRAEGSRGGSGGRGGGYSMSSIDGDEEMGEVRAEEVEMEDDERRAETVGMQDEYWAEDLRHLRGAGHRITELFKGELAPPPSSVVPMSSAQQVPRRRSSVFPQQHLVSPACGRGMAGVWRPVRSSNTQQLCDQQQQQQLLLQQGRRIEWPQQLQQRRPEEEDSVSE